jgi:exosortase E/protease (VPEID-CTERM system)
LLLFPLGTCALLLANVLRITVLIAIGNAGFTDLAVGGFHSQAGWIAFNVVALGIVALTSYVPFFRRAPQAEASELDRSRPTVGALLNPFLMIVAVGMLARALTTLPETLYPLCVVGAALILLGYRQQYRCLRWTVSAEALLAGMGGALVWIALVKPGADDVDPSAALVWPLSTASAVWLIFRVLGSTVTVPLAEELAFRGYLLRRLARFSETSLQKGVPWAAVALSSVLFGLMHGNWIAGSIAGAFYAIVFLRRRSLGDAVAAHATSNALLAVYANATGQWWLWS